jgi:hypothetical protein
MVSSEDVSRGAQGWAWAYTAVSGVYHTRRQTARRHRLVRDASQNGGHAQGGERAATEVAYARKSPISKMYIASAHRAPPRRINRRKVGAVRRGSPLATAVWSRRTRAGGIRERRVIERSARAWRKATWRGGHGVAKTRARTDLYSFTTTCFSPCSPSRVARCTLLQYPRERSLSDTSLRRAVGRALCLVPCSAQCPTGTGTVPN